MGIRTRLLADSPPLPQHDIAATPNTGRRRRSTAPTSPTGVGKVFRPEQCRGAAHRPISTPGTQWLRDFARDRARNPEISPDRATPINRFPSGSWFGAQEFSIVVGHQTTCSSFFTNRHVKSPMCTKLPHPTPHFVHAQKRGAGHEKPMAISCTSARN